MSRNITLADALSLFFEREEKNPDTDRIHPAPSVLADLAAGKACGGSPEGATGDRQRWLDHVARCPTCRRAWLDLLHERQAGGTVADVALPKVAAESGVVEEVTRVTTVSGRFLVTLRKNLEEPEKCLVTLTVLDKAEVLEDRIVQVRDKGGRVLLSAAIVQGEASGWLPACQDLDLSSVMVTVGE